MSPQTTEQIRIHRTPLTDAQDAAEAAFDRLRTRLAMEGVPTNSVGIGTDVWLKLARRAAPNELAEFVLRCEVVKTLMEDG